MSGVRNHLSVIGHASAGGMSRKTSSKKCTGLETMRSVSIRGERMTKRRKWRRVQRKDRRDDGKN